MTNTQTLQKAGSPTVTSVPSGAKVGTIYVI